MRDWREHESDERTIAELEEQIDRAWSKSPPPTSTRDNSSYQLLTAAEDRLRLKLSRPDEFSVLCDQIKYAMRSALTLIARQPDVSSVESYEVDWRAYERAGALLDAADSFEAARIVFGCFKRKEVNAVAAGNHVSFSCDPDTLRFEALDRIIAEASPDATISKFARLQKQRPGIVDVIQEAVCIHEGRVTYAFDGSVAKALHESLGHRSQIIPEAWTVFGVSGRTALRIVQGLQTRCAYHLYSVYYGATKQATAIGRAVSDLLLVRRSDELIAEVAEATELPQGDVAVLLDRLTFGEGTDYPDPALQPICRLASGRIAVPCLMLLTSSVGRNLLSLQTRVDRSSFDKQSFVFEAIMTQSLQSAFSRIGCTTETSTTTKAGEVDAIVTQDGCDEVLVIELKWCLPPGDAREVLNKTTALRKGADQARSKALAVHESLTVQSKDAGLSQHRPRRVLPLVVSQGFSCDLSDARCVPLSVLVAIIGRESTLGGVVDEVIREKWLPVPRRHFVPTQLKHRVEGTTLTWAGFTLTEKAEKFASRWICSLAETSDEAPVG